MSDVMTMNSPSRGIDNISILTNGELFERLQRLSCVMANSGEMVPQHYRGKPDACMAIVMQAARWGMDPFAVAQKTHIVNGMLGYEAQLVNAVVTTMSPTIDRLHYDWFGPWENVIGKFVEKSSAKGNTYIAPGWSLADEKDVGVRVWATLRGEDAPRELVLYLSQAQVRNSTLWASDPRQQLAYLGVKRWARLYCPDVILGVYSYDELGTLEEKDVTPPARVSVAQLAATSAPQPDASLKIPTPEKSVSEVAPEPPAPSTPESDVQHLRDDIQNASTPGEAKQLRITIEEQKDALGITLFTELKNKAVQRYHQLNAMASISTQFESLSPDLEDATAKFQQLSTLVQRSQRVLDPQEYERYHVALLDMKADYIQE
ncbi:RecT family recombinase [Pantoea coffeiphila]|uniref:Enterohemolysin n=1 Tax=Pantoea coffeiphila TaxID=1465635 RepID=A0A2S9I8B6_9GAMM|nr:RecT family recombinase [Pantoea coffeiphila]PRD14015.1 enterohemolysin [Pantoea coffeiphila]